MSLNAEVIIPGELTLTQLRRLCAQPVPQVQLDTACRPGIRASAALVKRATEGDAPVYGVNTGFGKLASTRIAREDLATLQLKLLRSHAVGVGEPMSERVVRLILLLKASSLARGFSGVREEVVDALINLHNAGVIPVIPCQGSVGASGDLAPLAHLSLPLIGEGEAFYQGVRMPGGEALAKAGLKPVTLGAKEGLALINGTQVSAGLAIEALLATDRLFEAAVISGALTLDAEIEIVAECDSGEQAIAAYRKRRPDLVLMDWRLPGISGVEATAAILREFPEARIVSLTATEGEEDIHRAVEAGVVGYLPKTVSRKELLAAIRAVHGGAKCFPPAIAAKLEERRRRPALNDRELAVLRRIVRGRSNKEIAVDLDLAEVTVKFHVGNLLEKLGAADRTQAATAAIQRGIIHLD